jgi:hypothetical protein
VRSSRRGRIRSWDGGWGGAGIDVIVRWWPSVIVDGCLHPCPLRPRRALLYMPVVSPARPCPMTAVRRASR